MAEVIEVIDTEPNPVAATTAMAETAPCTAMDADDATAADSNFTSENPLVGRTVRKCFSGRPYIGTVVGYDANAALYKVQYGDGDAEEMSVHELRPVLQAVDAMEVEATKAKEEKERLSYAENTQVGTRALAGEGDEPSPALYDYHAKAWCTTWGELKRLGWTYVV